MPLASEHMNERRLPSIRVLPSVEVVLDTCRGVAYRVTFSHAFLAHRCRFHDEAQSVPLRPGAIPIWIGHQEWRQVSVVIAILRHDGRSVPNPSRHMVVKRILRVQYEKRIGVVHDAVALSERVHGFYGLIERGRIEYRTSRRGPPGIVVLLVAPFVAKRRVGNKRPESTCNQSRGK